MRSLTPHVQRTRGAMRSDPSGLPRRFGMSAYLARLRQLPHQSSQSATDVLSESTPSTGRITPTISACKKLIAFRPIMLRVRVTLFPLALSAQNRFFGYFLCCKSPDRRRASVTWGGITAGVTLCGVGRKKPHFPRNILPERNHHASPSL